MCSSLPRTIPTQKYRRVTWTLFRTPLEAEELHEALSAHPSVSFHVFQAEICPKTQRPHLQGYLEVVRSTRMTMNQLKKILSNSVHLSMSNGSAKQNVLYCTKSDTRQSGPWQSGTPRVANSSLDCAPAAALLYLARHNRSHILMAEMHPGMYLRYRRALSAYSTMTRLVPRRWKTTVYLYWGPPDSGKTRLAHILSRNKAFCVPSPSCEWFDGYNLEADVIIDDLSPESLPPRSTMLRLLDRYPMQVPVKGGFVNWQPKRIFLTSNMCIEDLYPGDRAVHRRITETVQF